MSPDVTAPPSPPPRRANDPARAAFAFSNRIGGIPVALWWLVSLAIILPTLSIPAVDRSQEARVLTTAREMLGRPFHDWMIPHLNGQIRLNKPPMAYWMAAGSFELFGVSDGAGRLPFALCGWLAVGLTGAFGGELFGRRAGFFAAGALLGSLLFARLGRVAETDILVLLLMTAAVYAFWHAMTCADPAGANGASANPAGARPTGAHPAAANPAGDDRAAADAPRAATPWLYLASVAIGLMILAKGLPALFPVLFLIALAWGTRRWDLPWQWVKCGAPLAAVAIGAPWFIYVHRSVGLQTLLDEARIASVGMYHRAWFFNYFAWLLVAMAPWCGFSLTAVALAAQRWRDPRLRMLLIWSAAVFVPLCIAGQKQKHYLMPMLPAITLLIGWFCDRALRTAAGRDSLLRKTMDVLIVGTLLVCVAAALAAPIVGKLQRGHVAGIDWILAFAVAASMAMCLIIRRSRGAAAASILATVLATVLMALVTCVWSPTLRRVAPRQIAAAVRAAFGNRPCAFYGTVDLPTVYYLRAIVPAAETPWQLLEVVRQNPTTIVLVTDPTGVPIKPLPPKLSVRMTFTGEDKTIRVCDVSAPSEQP